MIQELYSYNCPKNSDNQKVKKLDDRNKSKYTSLYLDEILIEWMNGKAPQPLIAQIPKKVSDISYKEFAKKIIPLQQKFLEIIEDGMMWKGLCDNMYGQDKERAIAFSCFEEWISLLQEEYMYAGNPNDLHVVYYWGVLHYLRALYEYPSTQPFSEEQSKARCHYQQLLSQISASDVDFRFIVIFSHIRYECCIFINSLSTTNPSIQDIQYWWDNIYELFKSTERELNKYIYSAECLASYQKACIFIRTIKTCGEKNRKILVDTLEKMHSSYNDQIHIDKRMSDEGNAAYDSAIAYVKNISE